jgi:hypothetical protein
MKTPPKQHKLILSKKTIMKLNNIVKTQTDGGFGTSRDPKDIKCSLDACQNTYTPNFTCGANCQTEPVSILICKSLVNC